MGIFARLLLCKRSHHAPSPSLDNRELTVDETRETRKRGGMDMRRNGAEIDFEFWPIEHPIEPLDEDRPVKCPMPDSSVINDGRLHEERFSESLQKRAELSAIENKERMAVVAAEPPVRALRKRHHGLTHGDHTITPLLRMPPLYPHRPKTITIFDVLQ